MAKEFNITGTCIPGRDYMADTSDKLKKVIELVARGKYFLINRPRQYGKTTTLSLLLKTLEKSGEYLPFSISFEGVGDDVFLDEKSFAPMFLQSLAREARFSKNLQLESWLMEKSTGTSSLKDLSLVIAELVEKAGKKVVLLIDEVDKSSNNQIFVSFLGMLRDKYLKAAEMRDFTFHSVVLAGVHDVKTLKLKIRPDEERKFNSPWNIAVPFEVDMNLHPHEILPMLEDYAGERSVKMDAPAIAERLFYFTSGYPFLVSALCKILDEKILPKKSEASWTDEDVEMAVNMLLTEPVTNTNFDSLTTNLENNPELYRVVFNILMGAERADYNLYDPIIQLGTLYGIFSNGRGIKIHNRVYQELIVNYMTSKVKREVQMESANIPSNYKLPGNRLDIEKVLLKFQAFMKEQYSKQDLPFLERNGRLIFLAFLKPIINGGGWDFKEPQVSEEKRLDVAVTFFQHKYIVELKIWHGDAAHKEGLDQLADYLGRQHLAEGYLLIFNHSKKKSWKKDRLVVRGKKIFAAWV